MTVSHTANVQTVQIHTWTFLVYVFLYASVAPFFFFFARFSEYRCQPHSKPLLDASPLSTNNNISVCACAHAAALKTLHFKKWSSAESIFFSWYRCCIKTEYENQTSENSLRETKRTFREVTISTVTTARSINTSWNLYEDQSYSKRNTQIC